LGHAAIERLARQVRRRLLPNLLVAQALPGIKLFEWLDDHSVRVGGRQVRLNYEVGELPGSVAGEACYFRKSDTFIVKLSRETYHALCRDDPRARFSLAHELGHIYLHARMLMRMARIPHTAAALLRATEPPYPVFWDTEWQADSFAAALLMPAEALEELFNHNPSSLMVHHVRAWFNVSSQAARIRCENFLKRRDELLGR
jgi:hypothetical protein